MRDSLTRYHGKDGVGIGSFIRRAAFALRFSDPNILISGQITDKSRILMTRDIRDRVETLAPFLDFDADPYPVIVDGKTIWILDGYTTSDQYPYSQSVTGTGGLAGDHKYVRNSVKVTVDAYQGTVKFYVIDPDDPIIQAYEKAFPDLFTPFDRMPPALRKHLRYPEDLFKLQSNVFSKYHVVEPPPLLHRERALAALARPERGRVDDRRAGESEPGDQPVARDHGNHQAPGSVLPVHPASR